MTEERHLGPSAGVNQEFTTTHWSVVLLATREDSPHATQALQTLCRAYWYPLYAYIRLRGYTPEDAADLTQEFFARLIAKHYLAAVHPERGKFRWFLLGAVKRSLINQHERDFAAKRGGYVQHIPFDSQAAEQRYRLDAANPVPPDKLFDRAWATDLIRIAYRRLEEEYVLEGKGRLFECFRLFLSGDRAETTYAEAGTVCMMTEGAVKVAVHRLRRRYRDWLREQVAQTVHTQADLEEELRNRRLAFSDSA